ncbi:hypothetical protein TCAL_04368 [Tigriopus californicus]|uniref:Coiled-coil domain-containing protein n=1 Tax=Tigriopus californicus TaxID=6832 RepID=A0A553NQ34_TIGCA|nr:coiled-coil domain-containing protein 124-like [Tigriopus californicus]TRY67519.1 hypothetical protein TCAL_04368 [Tigriopus californicus]|eukprot:TCALIF_04368-PA protein Name:"Similar to ccdc124 Coiled-coil domain-containing protein 124 (Danio rerio)" AED:0.06 eAED:0.06 QI:205/1/1/1/1/1/3/78/217
MPKKFKGENSKAVEAKQKKSQRLQSQLEEQERRKEDELWKDDDKYLAKKKERREEQELKRLEQLEKKLERQKLVEEEESQIKSGKKTAKPPAKKMTRDQINKMIQNSQSQAAQTPKTKNVVEQDLMVDNVNRLAVEGDSATGVDEALVVLGHTDPVDKHPEKRAKAAYEEFEQLRLPELKADNPSLRLSQLKQMLRKEWMKHPDNPFNQTIKAYNNK